MTNEKEVQPGDASTEQYLATTNTYENFNDEKKEWAAIYHAALAKAKEAIKAIGDGHAVGTIVTKIEELETSWISEVNRETPKPTTGE